MLDGAGRKLAGPLASSGGAVLVTQISPDGGQVATIETVVETVTGPPRPIPYLFLAAADGSGRDTVARSTVATAWLGGRLLRDDAADDPPFAQQICLLASNTDFPCERLVAADPGRDLRDPAVSPDGTLVAAARAPGEIAIYSAATAALVRVVSSGPSDSAPDVVARRQADRLRPRRRRAVGRARRGRPRAAHPGVRRSSPCGCARGGPLRLSAPKRPRAGRVRIRLANAPRGARVAAAAPGGRALAHAGHAPSCQAHDLHGPPRTRPGRAASAGSGARRAHDGVAAAALAGSVARGERQRRLGRGAGSDPVGDTTIPSISTLSCGERRRLT